MTDEELGHKIVPAHLSIGYSVADYALIGKNVRELLAGDVKSVATREEVRVFFRDKTYGWTRYELASESLAIDVILAALSHFAPPAAPINGMTVVDLHKFIMNDPGVHDAMRCGSHNTFGLACAHVAHRLAQPGAEDKDREERAACWRFYAAVEPTYRDEKHCWEHQSELDKERWRAHVANARREG